MDKVALHIVAAFLRNDARVKSYLSILLKQGWELDVICYREEGYPDFEDFGNIRIYRVGNKYQGKSIANYVLSYIKFYKAASSLSKRLHRQRKYKFAHVHNMPNIIVNIASSLKPKPGIILDMHDLMRVNFSTKFGNGAIPSFFLSAEERISISKANQLICADKGQAAILNACYPERNPIVCMNLANPEVFQWSDHKWESGPFRFVYHGTVARRLGVDRVIKALSGLPEQIHFRLIGDGDDMPEVRKLVKDLNLESRVEMIPFVPVEDLPKYLQDCHAGVIPSRKTLATDTAMLPVKLLEYSAIGIPSVAANLSNIKLHFQDDEVLFFKATEESSLIEKMLEMAFDQDLRNSLVCSLKRFNNRNGWNDLATTYLAIVDEVVNASS